MKFILSLLVALTVSPAFAKVEVLFHPHDPTLEKIAEWITQANHTIDIAMYNMDVTDKSPVVVALKSPAVKQRLDNGSLKIRMVFEGYGTGPQNSERMTALENLGIDVRYLGKTAKVHHKFAVLDSDRVISGSANWSLSSYRNYNENILFFDREAEATYRFAQEFALLWNKSKEFGRQALYAEQQLTLEDRQDFAVHFNAARLLKSANYEQIYITQQLVRLIDEAKSEISIATTRIRLVPLLEAVHHAAGRGVQVKIVLSQDDYHDLWKRAQWLFNVPGIQLRVKFYNLKISNYLTYQMHNKFVIIDRQIVATGSFNWSESAENSHIENLVELRGAIAQDVLPSFINEFRHIWDLGRTELASLQSSLEQAKASGQQPPCGFKPTTLELEEIKKLLSLGRKCAG